MVFHPPKILPAAQVLTVPRPPQPGNLAETFLEPNRAKWPDHIKTQGALIVPQHFLPEITATQWRELAAACAKLEYIDCRPNEPLFDAEIRHQDSPGYVSSRNWLTNNAIASISGVLESPAMHKVYHALSPNLHFGGNVVAPGNVTVIRLDGTRQESIPVHPHFRSHPLLVLHPPADYDGGVYFDHFSSNVVGVESLQSPRRQIPMPACSLFAMPGSIWHGVSPVTRGTRYSIAVMLVERDF